MLAVVVVVSCCLIKIFVIFLPGRWEEGCVRVCVCVCVCVCERERERERDSGGGQLLFNLIFIIYFVFMVLRERWEEGCVRVWERERVRGEGSGGGGKLLFNWLIYYIFPYGFTREVRGKVCVCVCVCVCDSLGEALGGLSCGSSLVGVTWLVSD